MIFCVKKPACASSQFQEKLDADLKRQQQAGQMDEQVCVHTAAKLAWVTKQTGFANVGMAPDALCDENVSQFDS